MLDTCIHISSSLVECEDFVFETTQMDSTITMENKLVCQNQWISKILTFTTMIGTVIGPTVTGIISDRIGRIMTIGNAYNTAYIGLIYIFPNYQVHYG